jgi:hypothetical protein
MQASATQVWNRWGRGATAALALAVLTATVAASEERGADAGAAPKAAPSDSVGAGHAPPASAGEKGEKRGERDDAGSHPNRDADNRGDAGRIDRGAKAGPKGGPKSEPRAGTTTGPKIGDKIGTHGPDTIDMSVASPLRLPRTNGRDRLFKKIEAAKVAPVPRPHPHIVGPGIAGPAPRNAIGIASFEPNVRPQGFNALHPGPIPGPGSGASIRVDVAVPGPNGWHPGSSAPTAPMRGALNGTNFVRIGSGPAVIGGSARTVTGINGTTFRPKY